MNLLVVLLSLGFAFPQMVEIRRPEFAGHVEKKLAQSKTSKASVCEVKSRKVQASAAPQSCAVSTPKDSAFNKSSVSSSKSANDMRPTKTR